MLQTYKELDFFTVLKIYCTVILKRIKSKIILGLHGSTHGTSIGLGLLLAQAVYMAVFSSFSQVQEICLVSSRKIGNV